MNRTTILGEVAHLHPPLRVMPSIERDSPGRKSAEARRVLLKRMQCKTCLGKACIGRCRFGD